MKAERAAVLDRSEATEAKAVKSDAGDEISPLARRHLRFGWWSLLLFLTFGIVLEALHGFKVGSYLRVSNETRRLMWTLSHAHGTLLALVNLAFVPVLRIFRTWPAPGKDFVSASLLGASVLMPVGFFLGGLFIYAGDPGLGILLVPLGGLLLFCAVLWTALASLRLK
ncbi:MAG TPA: hypothetical protein VGR78_09435 [Verrucomicrobiae bacterium]|jgi:hypothetical protein|nr:hypothetical protein [Verrucomicrobiae bacterium]